MYKIYLISYIVSPRLSPRFRLYRLTKFTPSHYFSYHRLLVLPLIAITCMGVEYFQSHWSQLDSVLSYYLYPTTFLAYSPLPTSKIHLQNSAFYTIILFLNTLFMSVNVALISWSFKWTRILNPVSNLHAPACIT